MWIDLPEATADDIIEGWWDSFLRHCLRAATDRRDRAAVAAAITEDRYHAGSSAARAVLYVLLTAGLPAALEFLEDLECREP